MQAEVVVAGPGPVSELVAKAQGAASSEGRRLVVYVGANWCEPCKYFLSAVESNELPKKLGDLRFLKFDNDEDDERLSQAGYGGQMIPRFVVPGAEGRATKHRFEGSIKGPEAVANIVPRLEALLAR
jgi:thiol-disulfide isomerase/thioredoxin